MKKVKSEKIKELQGMTDEYVAKKYPSSNLKVKLLAGFLLMTSAVTLLASCSSTGSNADDAASKDPQSKYENMQVRSSKTEVSNLEMELEREIAAYLSAKTGVDINLIDIHDIDLVKSSGNYLVLTGEMITSVKEGNKTCSVTLELSDEQMRLMSECMAERVVMIKDNAGSRSVNLDEDVFARKYRDDILSKLESVIKDEKTVVSAIYDKDNKEWVFDKDEPVQSNNR